MYIFFFAVKNPFSFLYHKMSEQTFLETLLFEVCGLEKSNNGRECEDHEVCGAQVEVGSLVLFKFCTVHGPSFVRHVVVLFYIFEHGIAHSRRRMCRSE